MSSIIVGFINEDFAESTAEDAADDDVGHQSVDIVCEDGLERGANFFYEAMFGHIFQKSSSDHKADKIHNPVSIHRSSENVKGDHKLRWKEDKGGGRRVNNGVIIGIVGRKKKRKKRGEVKRRKRGKEKR